MEEHLAHSEKEGYPPQSYTDHSSGTTKLTLRFGREMKGPGEHTLYCKMDADQIENILCLAAPYHDLGKLNKQNQVVLHEKLGTAKHLPVNHVDAGAAFLKQKGLDALYSLILVYAHHQGLPDLTEENIRSDSVCYRDNHEAVRVCVDQELEHLLWLHRRLIPDSGVHILEFYRGNQSIFLRMMLSCLADADHSNTAAACGQYPKQEKIPGLQPELRLKMLNNFVESLRDKNKSKRNDLRMQVYKECRDCELNAGIVSNDGTVGIGKTTAIIAYQLKQAILRNARRIFVIQPFANIIEQSVDVYRQALVLPGEDPEAVVAELHFKADFENEDTRYLTALWRAPIIVTTAVAFFETLASNRPGSLRRLHELPGSIIFLDEAHAALPLKLLPLAWRWMNILEKEWSCSWILASGSLVRFWQLPELVGSQVRQLPEMVSQSLRQTMLSYEKNRIKFRWKQRPLSRAELIDWVMAEKGPRIVILNTVQSAAVIADDICKKYGRKCVEHISTALLSEDRENTIKAVKKRLADATDMDWVLVATSCVEAGVDFSFRNGFRELASTISLLQAAGRVDRNGDYGDALMWSFCMQDDIMLTSNPELKVSAGILEEYLKEEIEITPQLCTKAIWEELHRGKSIRKEIQALMEAEEKNNFKTVSELFHVIENDTVPVIVKEFVADKIRQGHGNWRELQKYSVSISKKNLDKWQVRQIADDVYQWTLPYDTFLGYLAGVLKMREI